MDNDQIVVPEIPEECKNKNFGASDIKWVKTVNDGNTRSAYIPPDKRVIENSNGTFFCLQLNELYRASLNNVPFGDLILLYQKINDNDNKSFKCFTHLVTPIGDKVITCPYPPDPRPGWPGRWVKVITMTGNQVYNSIPFEITGWQKAGFDGHCKDLNFLNGRIEEIPCIEKLPVLQNDIWNRFRFWPK